MQLLEPPESLEQLSLLESPSQPSPELESPPQLSPELESPEQLSLELELREHASAVLLHAEALEYADDEGGGSSEGGAGSSGVGCPVGVEPPASPVVAVHNGPALASRKEGMDPSARSSTARPRGALFARPSRRVRTSLPGACPLAATATSSSDPQKRSAAGICSDVVTVQPGGVSPGVQADGFAQVGATTRGLYARPATRETQPGEVK